MLLAIIFIGFILPTKAQYSAEDLTTKFFEGLAVADASIIEKLMPSGDDFKQIAPEEFGDKSEEEIAELMKRMNLAIGSKFQQIVDEGKKRKMKLNEIMITDVSEETIDLAEEGGALTLLIAINIKIKYQKKLSEFGLIALPTDGGMYLLDIPKSYNVFERLFEQ